MITSRKKKNNKKFEKHSVLQQNMSEENKIFGVAEIEAVIIFPLKIWFGWKKFQKVPNWGMGIKQLFIY